MSDRPTVDLSGLPTFGFGPRSPTWWGTLGFIALEGTGFALAGASYLYLARLNSSWPLSSLPPDHWPGTILTALLLAKPGAKPSAQLVCQAMRHMAGAHRAASHVPVRCGAFGDTLV